MSALYVCLICLPYMSANTAVTAACVKSPFFLSDTISEEGQEEGRRVGGLERGALPPPLQVCCGHCGVVLWERLRSYLLVGAQQGHIHSELWTHEPPVTSALAPHPHEPASLSACRRFLCRNLCHQRGLWLVDNCSGYINTAGFSWGIACGPGAVHTQAVALGFYRPVPL
eukprot:Tamp_25400.p1 GENE.Tamp_25400~~Tamp_25400.p1  ORF type:complete len:170 (-),score=2.81 Tamp_25400:363-872(-)